MLRSGGNRQRLYRHRLQFRRVLLFAAGSLRVNPDAAVGILDDIADAAGLKHRVLQLLDLDQAFAPHVGATREVVAQFDFDANTVIDTLESMEIPTAELFADNPTEVGIHIPGGVGDIIKDPDGGVLIKADSKSFF